MAMRTVDQRFWSDVWVRKLNALDRYLFLYLITNEHVNWSGIYELDIAMMAFESGINKEDLIQSMLPRLSPKVIYEDGWIFVKNFDRYHSGGPNAEKGRKDAIGKLPERIRAKISLETNNQWGKKQPPSDQSQGGPSSALALASALLVSGANAPRIVTVSEDSEEAPAKKESRVKDKEAIFYSFSPKKEPWWFHKQQKEAALRLYDMRGIDKVQKGIGIMREHSEDKYCPQAYTPFDYEQKLPNLNAYIKKNNL